MAQCFCCSAPLQVLLTDCVTAFLLSVHVEMSFSYCPIFVYQCYFQHQDIKNTCVNQCRMSVIIFCRRWLWFHLADTHIHPDVTPSHDLSVTDVMNFKSKTESFRFRTLTHWQAVKTSWDIYLWLSCFHLALNWPRLSKLILISLLDYRSRAASWWTCHHVALCIHSTGCSLGVPAAVRCSQRLEDRSERREFQQRGWRWWRRGRAGRGCQWRGRGGEGRSLHALFNATVSKLRKFVKWSCFLSTGGSGAFPRGAGELSAAAVQVYGRQRWAQCADTSFLFRSLSICPIFVNSISQKLLDGSSSDSAWLDIGGQGQGDTVGWTLCETRLFQGQWCHYMG